MSKYTEKAIKKIIADCVRLKPAAQRDLYDLLFDHVVYHTGLFKFTKTEQEDQIQESFIKIFCNIGAFDHRKSNIFTWSSIVTKRICLSYITKKKIKLTEIDPLSLNVGIEDMNSDFLELEIIYGLIEALPSMCKKVLNLSIIQGLDHTNIALLLDINTRTSRAYLSRAKSILRTEIKNHKEISTKFLNLKIVRNA